MAVRALYLMDCGGGEFDYGVLVALQKPGVKRPFFYLAMNQVFGKK